MLAKNSKDSGNQLGFTNSSNVDNTGLVKAWCFGGLVM